MKLQAIVLLALSVSLIGCALEPSYRAQQIQPAYPPMVAHCTFLGGVTGVSDLSYMPLGSQRAKYEALDQASELGATHIVWTEITADHQPTAQGRAYRCDH